MPLPITVVIGVKEVMNLLSGVRWFSENDEASGFSVLESVLRVLSDRKAICQLSIKFSSKIPLKTSSFIHLAPVY